LHKESLGQSRHRFLCIIPDYCRAKQTRDGNGGDDASFINADLVLSLQSAIYCAIRRARRRRYKLQNEKPNRQMPCVWVPGGMAGTPAPTGVLAH
jgi:hypothetical protein